MPMLDHVKAGVRSAAHLTRVGGVLPLDFLTRLYLGTDKRSHGYTPQHHAAFKHRRYRANRVLEIGVGGYESRTPAGSLRIWRDYFPRSRVVGFDLYEKDLRLRPRVAFVRGDQSDPVDLARAVEALGGPRTS